ncbi:MAG: hypothetical protein H0T55_03335 [Rubrobacteraceae bacterium]|nr:hypothetical protein [Rubrobacteraceae bacterium]
MITTLILGDGAQTEVRDPHAIPFPEGPLWDRLGHELVFGNDPEDVARGYAESPEEVARLSDLFWEGYGRARWLAEAREYGLLEELVELGNEELYARLLQERTRRDDPS